MRLKLVFAVLVALLLVVAAGCGGSKKSSTTKAATTTKAMTTSASTTSAGGSNLSSKTVCLKLVAAQGDVSKVMSSASAVPPGFAQRIAKLQALVKVAPTEIKSDLQSFADAGAQIATWMTKMNIKSGQQLTPAQIRQFASNVATTKNLIKLTMANQHLAAWAKATCNYKAPTVTIGTVTTG